MGFLFRFIPSAAVALLIFAGNCPAQALATVDGQPIFEGDLASSLEGPMRQIRRQEYEAKLNALEATINQRLVEAEARARKTTPEKLLAEEVDAKAAPPTDAEIEAFYLAQKDRINRPLDAVRAQISQGLRQAKLQQAREDFYRRLREKAKIAILLRPPKTEVAVDETRIRGDKNAPVTIVEFSDFQCPFCQRIQPVLLDLLAKYKGQVRVSYRDFPLSVIHSRAKQAAEAARCAGEQGKFWEYHDRLYADNTKLSEQDLLAHAKELGLDEQPFGACLTSGKYAAAVDEDEKAGERVGVSGTPAFFVNGVVLEGAQPITAFQNLIDSELKSVSLN